MVLLSYRSIALIGLTLLVIGFEVKSLIVLDQQLFFIRSVNKKFCFIVSTK